MSKGVIVCFLGYWSLSLVLSTFNPSRLYDVSASTYFILLLHLLLFVVGFSIIPPKSFKVHLNAGRYDVSSICNSWLFWVLFLVIVLFGVHLLITQSAVLAFYSTGNIKTDKLELLFEGSRLKYYFYDLICTPFFYFSMALFSYLLFYQKRMIHVKLALLTLIIIYSFIGGGRATVMLIVFFLLFFYFSGNRIHTSNSEVTPIKITLKSFLLGFLIVGVIVSGMVYVTYIGQHGLNGVDIQEFQETSGEFANQIIVYSLGPFRAFDYALNHPLLYFNSGYHFCRVTFSGLDYFLSLVSGVLGFPFTPINTISLSILQGNDIMVGHDLGFNFAYTSVIFPYMDLGIAGVCIYGLLFGYLSRKFILLSYKKSSFYYLALLGFVFYMLMYTIFSNGLNKDYAILYIALLLYLAKKDIIKLSR